MIGASEVPDGDYTNGVGLLESFVTSYNSSGQEWKEAGTVPSLELEGLPRRKWRGAEEIQRSDNKAC